MKEVVTVTVVAKAVLVLPVDCWSFLSNELFERTVLQYQSGFLKCNIAPHATVLTYQDFTASTQVATFAIEPYDLYRYKFSPSPVPRACSLFPLLASTSAHSLACRASVTSHTRGAAPWRARLALWAWIHAFMSTLCSWDAKQEKIFIINCKLMNCTGTKCTIVFTGNLLANARLVLRVVVLLETNVN